MSFAPPQIGVLVAALQRGNVVHYMHVSTACLVAYDYFTTLGEEIALVWNARWGTGKMLYLASRYLILPEMALVVYLNLFDVDSRRCHIIFAYSSCSALAGVTIAEVVLIMRTWAIWGAKRPMLLVLSAVLFCITASNGYLMSEFVRHAVFIRAAAVVPGAHGCVLIETSRRIVFAWLSVTLFELGIVVLTLIKGVAHFRLRSSSDLVSSLYRDGILYFVCLFAISLGNVLVLSTAPQEYMVLLGVPQRAFHALLACRIILHLRAASASTSRTPLSLQSRTHSDARMPLQIRVGRLPEPMCS